ncbi:MAG: hypothetical protein LBQ88_12275 [Treponema sp.]|jgi:flavodoxin|nr:hypothetical protein [Treponema sp.]
MKNIVILSVFVFCVTAVMQLDAQSQTGQGKILIAYFALPVTSETGKVDANSGASILVANGNTVGQVQFVADLIRKHTGGNLFAIQTVQSYPHAVNLLIKFAKNEQDKNARPRLAAHPENLEQYDTIFLGYPIWWYDLQCQSTVFWTNIILMGKPSFPLPFMEAAAYPAR